VRDLGVMIDSKLNFQQHINNTIVSANARANLILKCFISKDVNVLCKSFCTYVRPILEYCSPVWSPCSLTLIDQIESVQKKFTKRLKGFNKLSYLETLKKINLSTLELRRLHADLCMCYLIIHELIALPFDRFFEFSLMESTRGHNFKLRVFKFNSKVRQNFFNIRVVNCWNSLPYEIVNASNINVFKCFLSNYDFSVFLKIK
jgi:hypothetical protein